MEEVRSQNEVRRLDMAEHQYTCEFCTREFRSGRKRRGTKLCRNCIELRRLIRKWKEDGVWVKEAQEPKR